MNKLAVTEKLNDACRELYMYTRMPVLSYFPPVSCSTFSLIIFLPCSKG